MESSKPESTAISNSNDNPDLGFRSVSSLPSSDHASETSDLNHQAEVDALYEEFKKKLNLKDKEEDGETVTVNKDDKLGGSDEVSDKQVAEESHEIDGRGEYNDNCNENGELQGKLNLKDNDEDGETLTVNKDDKLDGSDEVSDKHVAEESYEVDGWGEYNDNWNENGEKKLNLKDKGEEGETVTVNKDDKLDSGDEVSDKHVAEESYEVDGWGEYNGNWNENEYNNWSTNVGGNENGEEGGDYDQTVLEGEGREETSGGSNHRYPVRPEAEDCAYYLKTGTCKFGFNCKFNHPINRRKNQADKEKVGEREESADRLAQAECKFYLSTGGCKFGSACKYNHSRGKCLVVPALELNFLGLPIRLGEKECPYYMRTGSCKFGTNCRFNHPDPTAGGGSDVLARYGKGGTISLQRISRPSTPSWSSARTLDETTNFMPMILPPAQGVAPQKSEWNMYQAPIYLPEGSIRPPSAYIMNNPAIEKNIYMQHQKKMQVEEFPERPGEPECSYFLKTGACKFKSSCKFHHPRNRITKLASAACTLSDKGLPLRPDQNVCSHYSRYGICKFGPACKFDHPINQSAFLGPSLDQQSPYSNPARTEVAENGVAN